MNAATREREATRATLAIGGSLAALVGGLQGRIGEDVASRERIARFAMACGFSLLMADLGVGEAWLREALGRGWRIDEVRAGWRATAELSPFARHLFVDADGLLLRAEELRLLGEVAAHDWSAVEPSIFGGLLEQSLRSHERARLGAHFTPRAYVERIVEPTMLQPLRTQWRGVLAQIERARAEGSPDAEAPGREFLARLGETRVLDPACGTGNFLYVAMDLLRGFAREVQASLGVTGEVVRPGQFLGIERKRWSQQIAELVLWVGDVQGWRADDPPRSGSRTGEIVVGDALLERDASPTGWRARVWPEVEFIVSNPPFIGNKRMRELLGDADAEAVRAVYAADGLPGDVEYVAYWWHKAALRLCEPKSRLRRFGFITTNSVRQRQSGAVLRRHVDAGVVLQFACPDHPWIDPGEELGSAAVRISMTVGRRADEAGAGEALFVEDLDARRTAGASREAGALRLCARRVERINADLTIGADLTRARPLAANAGLCFQGMNLVGEGFRVSEAEAAALRGEGVIRRYVQGRDLKAGSTSRSVIDLYDMDEASARAAAPGCLEILERRVRPERVNNARESYARKWWLFGEPRPGLRRAIVGLSRYIATPETSAHRFFVMLAADVVPDHQIYVVASEDMFVFGVLSSRVHGTWARRAGGSNGVGNDSRWNSRSTFLTFPFPGVDAAQRGAIAGVAERLAATRRSVLAESPGASLTGLYNLVECMRRGEVGGARERVAPELAARVLRLHEELDRAVLAAYGFAVDVDEQGLLAGLLALNLERSAAGAGVHAEGQA